jgi:hypothetical protein
MGILCGPMHCSCDPPPDIGFVGFQLHDMYNSAREVAFFENKQRMTAYAALALPLLLATIVVGGICTTNFNRGLKPHLRRRVLNNSTSGRNYMRATYRYIQSKTGSLQIEALPARMAI